jgi:hypothetical protein
MKYEVMRQMRSIATRLEQNQGDPVAQLWAEQDLRAAGLRLLAHEVRTAIAAATRAIAGAAAGPRAGRMPLEDAAKKPG